MTVLEIIRQACGAGIALDRPSAVFGSSVRAHVELGELAQEMAEMIAAAGEWQSLKQLAELAGDGSREDFPLPDGYRRMLVSSRIWTTDMASPLRAITDPDEWLAMTIQNHDLVINAWILYGDEIHIKPALGASETAKFWYLTRDIVKANGGAVKPAFTADNDAFRLDDRLLKLGIIWRWREMKGLPYAENLADYERLQAKLLAGDKGARKIVLGRPGVSRDVRTAYPRSIIG